eukprot:scpid92142/ scgid17501/ 
MLECPMEQVTARNTGDVLRDSAGRRWKQLRSMLKGRRRLRSSDWSTIDTVNLRTDAVVQRKCFKKSYTMQTVAPKQMPDWPKSVRSQLSGIRMLKVAPKSKRDEMYHELSLGLLLSGSHHENIARVYPFFFQSFHQCGYLMEATPDTLLTYSKREVINGRSVRSDLQDIIRGACEGLQLIHQLGFVHNAIQLDTILVQHCRDSLPVGKISNFSSSLKNTTKMSKDELMTYIDTPMAAPEILTSTVADGSTVVTPSRKMDIWAMGICIWQVYSGCCPWKRAALDGPDGCYTRFLKWLAI